MYPPKFTTVFGPDYYRVCSPMLGVIIVVDRTALTYLLTFIFFLGRCYLGPTNYGSRFTRAI